MPEDPWTGKVKIECPKCGAPVGQIPKEQAEGRALILHCPNPECRHSFDYEHPAN